MNDFKKIEKELKKFIKACDKELTRVLLMLLILFVAFNFMYEFSNIITEEVINAITNLSLND